MGTLPILNSPRARQPANVDIKNARPGLFGVFSLIVLIFSVTRGLIPIMTGNSGLARPIYTFSFILGAILSSLGLYLALFKKSHVISKNLRLLLVINFMLHVIWILPLLFLNPDLDVLISFAYTGLFPFAIFGLTKIPEKHLTMALVLFTLLLAGTVMWDFVELNTTLIPGGFDLAMNRQMLLRPDNYETFGRTGELLRPVGIFGGRPHDAGNLLAILSAYWVALLFRRGGSKFWISAISALGISGLMMTQSASNIAAFFVGMIFILVAYRKMIFSFVGTLRITTALITAAVVLYVFANYLGIRPGMLWQWSKRVGPDGPWSDMTALGITDVGADLSAIFMGHGSSLGLSRMGAVTELGFLKLLIEFGLIPWVVLMTTLIYPVWRHISARRLNNQFALPHISALVVGFISLWHYGSVLRTTNEFVFFALYAHALKISAHERLTALRAAP